MRGAPYSRRQSKEPSPASLGRRFPRPRLFFPAIMLVALLAVFWPARELRSDNFVFYFPSGHHVVPVENVGGTEYLPLLQVLNAVGKIAGIQEKRNSLKVWFGSTQIELRANETKVHVEKASIDLPHAVRLTNGQWTVPLDFLTTVLPNLLHQAVEYQEGTNRIFFGDVKPASFTVHVDPIANGARLTVQFTDKVTVRTASSNGKWVMFLGDRPMEPMEPAYHFQNPYLNELQYDDQDGVPKLILSPAAAGLNFYPSASRGREGSAGRRAEAPQRIRPGATRSASRAAFAKFRPAHAGGRDPTGHAGVARRASGSAPSRRGAGCRAWRRRQWRPQS